MEMTMTARRRLLLDMARRRAQQETRDIFRRWLPEALEDLESLIALGRLEMGT